MLVHVMAKACHVSGLVKCVRKQLTTCSQKHVVQFCELFLIVAQPGGTVPSHGCWQIIFAVGLPLRVVWVVFVIGRQILEVESFDSPFRSIVQTLSFRSIVNTLIP